MPPDPPFSTRLRVLELLIQALILYSIGMHFIEIQLYDEDHSTGFFLWSERCVASIFTIEYITRWVLSRSWLYPFRLMAIVDLIAILPFYVGFMVDLRSLRLVRTLRVLRVFKFYRYNAALHHLANAFWRIRHEFAVIGFALVVVVWCGSLAIHELERTAQPENFGKMSDALWYVLVTVTTVGYGDKVPMTQGGRATAVCVMLAGLMLFGTFISLIGSAFIEEVRKTIEQRRKAKVGQATVDLSGWPDLIDRLDRCAPRLGLEVPQLVRLILHEGLPACERRAEATVVAVPLAE